MEYRQHDNIENSDKKEKMLSFLFLFYTCERKRDYGKEIKV